jgi:uncharacterized protein
MSLTPLALSAITIEVALTLAGLALLWRYCLRPASRSPQVPSPLTEWNANLFHIVFLAWMVLVGGILLPMIVNQIIKSSYLDGTARQVISGAAFQIGMLLGCIGFVFYTDAGKQYSRPKLGFFLPGIVCFCIALPLVFSIAYAWGAVLQLFGIPAVRQDLVDLLRGTHSYSIIATLLVMAGIVAPIGEELIFRAGLFRFMRTRAPRWVALLVPAVFFGLLHGNLASFPQLVALGVVFSLSYERTGNIAVPIFAHALFNLNTIALLLAGVDA